MLLPVYSLTGEIAKQIEIKDDVFGLPLNGMVVHQAMLRQLANRRQGTASTKIRGEVSGSTRKLFRQKYTDRARRGSIKSPLLRGGGVAFGPKPRSYRQSMPKKMRRLALKCLLSSKVREGNIKVVGELNLGKPRTEDMINILSALTIDSTALVVTAQSEPNVVKSARNLTDVKVLPSDLINVLDLLSYELLIATVPAIRNIEQIWGSPPLISPLEGKEEGGGEEVHASL